MKSKNKLGIAYGWSVQNVNVNAARASVAGTPLLYKPLELKAAFEKVVNKNGSV